MRHLLITALVAACLTMPAQGQIVITNDLGGEIDGYLQRYRQIAQSHQRVVIDGECTSACTLVLSLPPGQACVTPRARLGVHLGWLADRYGRFVRNFTQPYTERALHYPRSLRVWISRHGGLAPAPKYITGSDLTRLIRPC